jgi:phosphopentomutase
MNRFKRVALIVLDSVGIGALPDAGEFNDEGAHTLGHIAEYGDGLKMPNLQSLGLGNIETLKGLNRLPNRGPGTGK